MERWICCHLCVCRGCDPPSIHFVVYLCLVQHKLLTSLQRQVAYAATAYRGISHACRSCRWTMHNLKPFVREDIKVMDIKWRAGNLDPERPHIAQAQRVPKLGKN